MYEYPAYVSGNEMILGNGWLCKGWRHCQLQNKLTISLKPEFRSLFWVI